MKLRFGGKFSLAAVRIACLAVVLPLLFPADAPAADDDAPAGEETGPVRSEPSEIMGQPETQRYSIGDILFGSTDAPEDAAADGSADEAEDEAEPEATPAPDAAEEPQDVPSETDTARDQADPETPPATEPEGEAPVLSDALRELMEINPVVARVDGAEIRWAEVVWSSGDLPLEDEEQVESLFPALLDRLIDLKLLAAAARRAALDQDEDIKLQIAIYEDNLIRERLLSDHLAEVVTEEAVRKRYEDLVRATDSSHQIRARHILLSSEEEARKVIEHLDVGSDFTSLARSRSIGPSADRGGDLGYFDPSRMVPEFASAALALEVGAYSTEPVRTAFGWHVIQLLDHRMEGVPNYDEMRRSITEQLRQEEAQKFLRRLRSAAAVEYFPEAIEPAGESGEAKSGPETEN